MNVRENQSTLPLKAPNTDMNYARRGFWDAVRAKGVREGKGTEVTTISMKIAMVAGLAMSLSFGTALLELAVLLPLQPNFRRRQS
jgi:hypothetical protein